MKDPKIISLVLIPYLTICSVLYHIAFWDTFNLNGLLYISISDILKSAAQPIGLVFISSVLSVLFLYFIGLGKLYPVGGGEHTKIGKALNSKTGLYISVLLLIILIVTTYFRKDPERWATMGYLTALPIAITIYNKAFFLNEIPNPQFRYFVILYFVYLPLLSFATGKKESEFIFKNIRYKYSISHSPRLRNIIGTDTLKFIGASSQKVFFTDKTNSTTFLINSNIDTLILKEKK